MTSLSVAMGYTSSRLHQSAVYDSYMELEYLFALKMSKKLQT